MKRGLKKDYNLHKGIENLKLSLSLLLIILVVLILIISIKSSSVDKVVLNMFGLPQETGDFMVLFAGSLIFIVVPLVMGLKNK
jgi:hypothetical protein